MSDEKKISLGFWAGIFFLLFGAFIGGLTLAKHIWWQAAVNLLITAPCGISILVNNRKSAKLLGQIRQMEDEMKYWRAQP